MVHTRALTTDLRRCQVHGERVVARSIDDATHTRSIQDGRVYFFKFCQNGVLAEFNKPIRVTHLLQKRLDTLRSEPHDASHLSTDDVNSRMRANRILRQI